MSQLVERAAAEGGAHAVPVAKASTVVALGFTVTILEGYDIQAIGVAAPKLIPALGLSHAETSWVFSASMIGLVIGALIGGWLADRIGRKPVLIASVLAFGVFSVATVAASDFQSLFMLRLATGLGLGGAVPNLIAVANEVARKERRTITTTMMFAGMPLGGAIAALVAQYVLPHMDWRVIFLMEGLLPIAVAPVVYFLLPETGSRALRVAERPKILGALLGPGQAAPTLLLWTGFFLNLIVLYLLLNWLPLLAMAKGVDPADASISSVMYNLGSIPGALILGLAVDRFGLRLIMLLSYGSSALVMVALAVSSGYTAMALLSACAGFSVVGNSYVLYGVAPIFYPPSMRGTGAGAAVAVGRLGSIIGPLVAGALLTAGFSASTVMLVLCPTMACAGGAIILLSYCRAAEQA